MAEKIRIKKGFDIPLAGKPSSIVTKDTITSVFAISPDDFPGPVWKAVVKPEDKVAAGDPLLIDKASGKICLVSPVAGSVKEVHRGERRHIEFVSVVKENESNEKTFSLPKNNADEMRELILKSGLWAMMRQRPFDIVPSPEVTPRDIFVTAFDSAPLAGELLTDELAKWLESGLEILAALTSGKVYLGIPAGSSISSKAAEVYEFEGPHPAGNVGTQIAAIKPVNKGETVWALDVVTASKIGKLIKTGKADLSTVVAVTGPDVKDPHLVETFVGASIATIIKNNLVKENGMRIISGNVLTGVKVSEDGFLHYPYRQITVIDEGDDADEFMGWASLSPKKFSVKRSFPAFLSGLSKPFHFDARIKGGHRAMILSGEYDKVFPFDIYPEFLLKAIIAKDIDKMEKLGIYEVAPEDFALPEFVDTSKIELQKIVREGLDYLRKELS
ncbi:MAG: Na(+)-translocating NADH-quinone reductase subunit A [Muribaculaceae bacterium]|nr:Na(+)-translocating NADH-quinone reductase subunit A [Muribaculaceae bacterium]